MYVGSLGFGIFGQLAVRSKRNCNKNFDIDLVLMGNTSNSRLKFRRNTKNANLKILVSCKLTPRPHFFVNLPKNLLTYLQAPERTAISISISDQICRLMSQPILTY